jgi:hypothetical protein
MAELKSEWYSVDFTIKDILDAMPQTVWKQVQTSLLKKAIELIGPTKKPLTAIDHIETDVEEGILSCGVYN